MEHRSNSYAYEIYLDLRNDYWHHLYCTSTCGRWLDTLYVLWMYKQSRRRIQTADKRNDPILAGKSHAMHEGVHAAEDCYVPPTDEELTAITGYLASISAP